MRHKLINKQIKKRRDKECYFCGERDYAVLDVHRIIPGEEGGKYTEHNSVTCCSNCHRRVHDGQILIDRKYPTTSANMVLHFWENGEEKWK